MSNFPDRELVQFSLSFVSLADLAEFVVFARKTYNLTDQNKWIAYGGSYPGSLSAWFRIKVTRSAKMLLMLWKGSVAEWFNREGLEIRRSRVQASPALTTWLELFLVDPSSTPRSGLFLATSLPSASL